MAIFQACTLFGYVGIFTYDLNARDYAVMKGFNWRVVQTSSSGLPQRVLKKGVMPRHQPDNDDRYGLFISVHDICCADRRIGLDDMKFVHNFTETMDILYENSDKIFVNIPVNIKDRNFWYGDVNGLPALLIPEDIGDTEAKNIFRRYGLYATRVYERGGELNSGVAFAVTKSPLGKDDVFTINNPKDYAMTIVEMSVRGKYTHSCVSERSDWIKWDEYHLSDGEHFIVTKERLPYSFDGKYNFLGKEVYRYDAIYNLDEESQIITIKRCDQKHPASEPCGTILSLTPLEGLEFVINHGPLRHSICISSFVSEPALLDVEERVYRRIKICDVDCLTINEIPPYTNRGRIPISQILKRISDKKEIKHLYRYDIVKTDDDDEIGEIVTHVSSDYHGGTILSMEPILDEREGYKFIDLMTDVDYDSSGSDISIRDYIVSKPE